MYIYFLFKGETLSSNTDDNKQKGDLNRRKKTFDEQERVNLAKPFDLNERKQKREGQKAKYVIISFKHFKIKSIFFL